MTLTKTPTLVLVPTEEEQAIRAAVASICATFGDGYARRKYDEGVPPTELWQALSAAGYVGISVPIEWGGGGAGISELAMVVEEVAAATGILPTMLVVSAAICGPILTRHGTQAQKQRWLKGIAAGTFKMAFGITEPDAGSNSHLLRTELRRDRDGYRLSGQKVFISGVEDADAVLVAARMRNDDGSLGSPTLAVVDVDAPGFTRQPISMQYIGPEMQWQLFFDAVAVEPDRVVGGENSGLAVLFEGLNPERIIGAAMACGLARLARIAPVSREMILNHIAQHMLHLPKSY